MKKLIFLFYFFIIPALVILISCSDNPLTPVQTDNHIYELYQNYPNPFNGITKIKFAISQTGFVNMKIINSGGNEIATKI